MRTIKIFGINVTDTTENEALEFIIKGLGQKRKKMKIFTPNPEIIMAALKDEDFKKVLNSADLALPDGIGILWAAKILGKQLQERIAGIDFMEMLCREASNRGFSVGLMGGGPKIAEEAAECLQKKYPGLKVSFTGEEWRKSGRLDILFVALGYPKQERWIYENLPKIPVTVAMAVGGSFDYISGAVPRAPKIVRNLGFEWLFRVLVEPWRLARQLALVHFILLILRTRFSLKTK